MTSMAKTKTMKILKATALAAAVIAATIIGKSCEPNRSPHVNAAAKRWTTLTADAKNVPISVEDANLVVTYTIDNIDCLKPRPISGATAPPFEAISVPVRKIGSATFEGTLALDRFMNEDYDGRGVCQWRVSAAEFTLGNGSRRVTAGMVGNDILQNASETDYFSSWSFTSAPRYEPQAGLSDPNAVRTTKTEKLYSVTVDGEDSQGGHT
jgi:hypothetical protein